MKRILLPILLLLALPALAREITAPEAARAASAWVGRDSSPLEVPFVSTDVAGTRTVADANGVPLFHIVRMVGGGVVVTSAETGITPIIAFLDGDDIAETDENPLWRILNADLAVRNAAVAELRVVPAQNAAGDGVVAAAAASLAATEGEWASLLAVSSAEAGDVAPAKSLTSVSDVRVAPLVQSTWTQGSWNGEYTFNYHTPNHYVCGCVATAGAQVMRFWEKPTTAVAAANCTAFVDGVEKTLQMKGGVYNWDNMPLRQSDCSTETQREAIGRLLYDLGVATHMSYTSGGSGAFGTDMAAALRSNFGYKSAKAVWLENGYGIYENIAGHAAARNAILASLDAKMPVTLSVYGDGGHHIVADGYGYSGSTLYTHINMGWNGSDNAWYNLIDESMTGYNFTQLSEVIYNIHPDYGPGDLISGRVTDSSGHPISGATVTLSASGMTPLTAKTCPTGIYAFMVGSAATYTVTAQSGSASSERTVTISRIGTTAEMRYRSSSGGSIKTCGSVGNVWGVDFSLDGTAPSLDAPTGVAATDGTSASTIAVTWNAVSGATSYTVYRGSSSQATQAVAENVSGTSWSDTAATPGAKHWYRVRAFNASGSSDYSDPDSGWRLLSAPASLSASDGTSSAAVELSWSASAGASSYTIFRGEVANPTDVLASGVTGTSYSDTSAAVGTTYHYRVKAVSSLCESGYSGNDTGYRSEPFAANLTASDGASASYVTVSWDAVPNAVSYTLYRGSSASASDVLKSGVTSTSYNDTSASPGTRYYYRLKAIYANGTSPYSNADSGWRALSAPSGLSASDGTSETAVALSWGAVSGATSYTVYRGTAANPTAVLASGVTGTSYSDTSAVAGTTYHYRVKAVCALGSSGYSNDETGYRRTSMSAILTAADGISADSVHVSWTSVSGASCYFLYRGSTDDTSSAVLLEGGLTDTSYDDINATPGKKYWYRIKAKFGNDYSGFSNSDSGYRLLLPPTGLAADKGKSTSNVTVKWNKAVGATSYTVYRGYRSGKDWRFSALAGGITAESYTDTTAEPGTVYNYYAVAVCNLCRSDVSEDDTGWIKMSAPTLEAVPGDGKINLSWTAVDGAVTYSVYRGTTAAAVTTLLQAGVAGTSYEDTTAIPEQHYFYKVVAVNAGKTSDDSNIVEVWRNPEFFTTMTASDGTSTAKIDVSWTAVTGASSYDLYRHTRTDAGVMSADTLLAGNLNATQYADTSATPGVVYWYRIKANYRTGGTSDFCKSDSGYRKLSPPTGLAATQGELVNAVKLTWSETPEGATSYLIARGTSANATVQIATSTTKLAYTDTTATPGTLFYYKVAAVGGVSTSAWSTAVSGHRKLAAPGSMTASDGTTDECVALSWPAVPGATSYKVFRGDETDTAPETLLATSTTNAFDDASATAGEYYWYRVTAVCALSESDFSKADRGYRSLPMPKNLQATDGTLFSEILVTWSAVSNAATYTLYRATADNPTAVWADGLTETSFSDVWAKADTTPLTPGVKYWYRVKANYENGTSGAFSASDSGYVGLAAPQGLAAADGASTANVALSWGAVNGAKNYLIARNTDTNEPPFVIKEGQTGVAFNDTTATNGVLYWYRVAAVATGVCTSEWSAVDSGYRMLAAPLNVRASDGTSFEDISLTWNPAAGAESYLVYRGDSQTTIDTLAPYAVVSGTETNFVDDAVEPGPYYWYQVAAASAVCTGAVSVADSGYRCMEAPGGFSATDGAYTNQIDLAWTSVDGAASYTLYRGTASNSVTTVVAANLTETEYSDMVNTSVPKPGIVYWYRVQATAPSGTLSAFSEPDSGYMDLSTPELSASWGTSAANVALTWPAVFGAARYNIYRVEGTNDIPCELVKGAVSGTAYNDATAVPGVLYSYALEAYSAGAITGRCSVAAAGWRQVVAPTNIKASDGTSLHSVAVTWNASVGALSYTILRGDSASTATNVIATGVTALEYTDTTGVQGTVYWYAVQADGKDFSSVPGTADRGHRLIPAPAVAVSDGTTTERITVEWGETAYATSYILYRGTADNPTAMYATNIVERLFNDADVTPGTLYWYRVKAVCEDGTASDFGPSDSGWRRIAAPAAPTVMVSGTSLVLRWAKPTGASHTRVWRATSQDAAQEDMTPLGSWTTAVTYTDTTCVGGVTYWYFIEAAADATGARPSDIGAGASGAVAPANDAFEKAFAITGASGTARGTNAGATTQTGEPQHAMVPTFGASVWWRWTAPTTGRVSFETAGSDFDAILAVYVGTRLNALTRIVSDAGTGANGSSSVTFDTDAGQSYYIVVAGRTSADTGNVVLHWSDGSGGGDTPTRAPDIGSASFETVNGQTVFRLTFWGETGFAYLVQRKELLADKTWTTVQRIVPEQDGQVTADIAPDPNAASAFFRILVE